MVSSYLFSILLAEDRRDVNNFRSSSTEKRLRDASLYILKKRTILLFLPGFEPQIVTKVTRLNNELIVTKIEVRA
jgi:hypothetical protein